ncbi:hypothetical protein RclHR1_09530008 [Rhizophagus clarus]|uniref:Uncharacterized protein n=1 Tax=Rhizophagus clarus TaxID=94130 RepID=A0A2Z6SAR7_9GLOM|nr:hypothetical protein RclHR1_09530008 [Rhizophagus clarus]
MLESHLIEKVILDLMEEEEDFMDLNDDDDIEEIFTFGLLILNKIRYIEPRVYNVLVLIYVKLPTDQARKFIHEGFKAIGCIEDIIGIIDGTHLILQNAPQKDKEVYFTRKKRYALHWQGIVDFRELSYYVWEDDDNFVDDYDNDELNNLYDEYDEEGLKRAGEAKREWVMRELFKLLDNG